jgi:hypothetical protein
MICLHYIKNKVHASKFINYFIIVPVTTYRTATTPIRKTATARAILSACRSTPAIRLLILAAGPLDDGTSGWKLHSSNPGLIFVHFFRGKLFSAELSSEFLGKMIF